MPRKHNPKAEYICDQCGASFHRWPSQNEGKHVFCCKTCSDDFRRTRVPRPCANCGTIFDRDSGMYCSQACAWAVNSGDNHYKWDGGRHFDQDGYARVTIPGYGRVIEHRWVWEQSHGPIPEGFVIHHKDMNPQNNALSNLELMTAGDHTRLHRAIFRWSRTHDFCIECGTNARPYGAHGLCSTCYMRHLRRLKRAA